MEVIGHYYTVYYVSLLVGFDEDTSFKLAFYTQLPDQVEELDAVAVTKKGGITFAVSTLAPFTILTSANPNIYEASRKRLRWAYIIQTGLHALSGDVAKDEQKLTTDLIAAASTTQPIEYVAFLIHRLGDTYAHTSLKEDKNPNAKLYRFPYGHAGPDLDVNSPDDIHNRFFKYREYAKALFKILSVYYSNKYKVNIDNREGYGELNTFLNELQGKILGEKARLKQEKIKTYYRGVSRLRKLTPKEIKIKLWEFEQNQFELRILSRLKLKKIPFNQRHLDYDPYDEGTISFAGYLKKNHELLNNKDELFYYKLAMQLYCDVIRESLDKKTMRNYVKEGIPSGFLDSLEISAVYCYYMKKSALVLHNKIYCSKYLAPGKDFDFNVCTNELVDLEPFI